jgi:hypothetical protein
MAPIPMMVRVRDRILEYAGKDISVVEAWERAAPEAKAIHEIEEKLAEKLSDVLLVQVTPDRVKDSLEHVLGVPIPRRVYTRAVKLVARNAVRIYRYDPRDVKVYGRVGRYEVEVALWGAGVRRCDCGADSTEDENAVCEHMVAAVIQALLEGLIAEPKPAAAEGLGSDLLDEL